MQLITAFSLRNVPRFFPLEGSISNVFGEEIRRQRHMNLKERSSAMSFDGKGNGGFCCTKKMLQQLITAGN